MNRVAKGAWLRAVACLAMLALLRCGDNGLAGGGSETDNTGMASVRLQAFDGPPPAGVEHVYLHLKGVELHGADGGWLVLSHCDTVLDFVQLIDGAMALLADTALPAGRYTQMRVLLGDSNSVVVSGVQSALVVPSGGETGVKIGLGFDFADSDSVVLYLDVDLSESINWNAQPYVLKPQIKAFRQDSSGSVSGSVSDTRGTPVARALVQAMAATDTLGTLTAPDGSYWMALPQGLYDLRCVAAGFAGADTQYSAIGVSPGASLGPFGFVLR